jgi:hypothetical protein
MNDNGWNHYFESSRMWTGGGTTPIRQNDESNLRSNDAERNKAKPVDRSEQVADKPNDKLSHGGETKQ